MCGNRHTEVSKQPASQDVSEIVMLEKSEKNTERVSVKKLKL